ncbi:MAG: KEOPS complex subunit Pcc1 [Halobacteriota archaeon]|nr:KEOPS complex subunit Pcc1 [Halobacteriota archaeon]
MRGMISLSHKGRDVVAVIAASLRPDNMSNMETVIKDDAIVTSIETDRLSSLISTIDDYLMNAKVAEDLCQVTEVL